MPVILNRNRLILLVLSLIFLFALSAPAFGANEIIAKLDSFSGKVIIKSQGSWGVKLRNGLPLYSGDTVATENGTATIKCDDGTVMELGKNSNLTIEERNRNKGFLSRAAVVERRLRLMIGKLFFKTGRGSEKENRLETPTMVCGLRGTAGTLSIAGDGTPMITFTEGGRSFTIGELVDGVAEDVPTEVANLNPVQWASFAANAAAAVAAQAKAQAESAPADSPEAAALQALAAYQAAQAAKATANAVRTVAQMLINNNPDPDVVGEYNDVLLDAEAVELDAQGALNSSISKLEELGIPIPEESSPFIEAPTFDVDVPVTPEPEVQDSDTASPV